MTKEERENAIRCLKLWIEKEPYIQTYKTCLEALEQESCEDWYDVSSNEMNLEQARQAVKDLRKKLVEHIEQKPCEDTISRQAVMNYIHRILNQGTGKKKSFEFIQKYVEKLPSIKPQEPKTVKSCDTCKHDEAFGCPSFIHDRCENYSEWAQADGEKNCFNCKWYPDNGITKGFDEVCHKCSNSDKWEGLIKRAPWEDIAPPPKIPEAQADGEYIPKQVVLNTIDKWYEDKADIEDLIVKITYMLSVAIPPDHDGCKDCKYETYPEYYYPCCECKQNYTDEWQKKPHWIEHEHEAGENWEYSRYECSECHEWSDDDSNFCPNCGAKMGGEEE